MAPARFRPTRATMIIICRTVKSIQGRRIAGAPGSHQGPGRYGFNVGLLKFEAVLTQVGNSAPPEGVRDVGVGWGEEGVVVQVLLPGARVAVLDQDQSIALRATQTLTDGWDGLYMR